MISQRLPLRHFPLLTLGLVVLLQGPPASGGPRPPEMPVMDRALSGQSTSIHLVPAGSWPYGPALAVDFDTDRNLIFLGSGGAVLILDGSDPTGPQLLNDEIRSGGLVMDLFYDSATGLLFLACGEGGLEIWNLSDPAAPKRLSVTEVLYFDVETPVENVDVYSHFAIVECAWGFVHSLDVSDPAHPVQVSFNGMMGNPAHDLHVSQADGQAHTSGAQYYQRLSIQPDGQLLGSGAKDFTYGPYAVFGTPDVGFVGYGGDLYLVDLLLGGWALWSVVDLDGISDLVVENRRAYVINNGGLHIIDATQYGAPVVESSLMLPDYPDRITLDADRALVVSGQEGLSIVDVGDPTAPAILGGYDVPSVPWETQVVGDYAFMAHAYEGLMVLDIADLQEITLVGQLDTPGEARDMWIIGDLLYLADWDGGLRIIDISTPAQPAELGAHEEFDAWRVRVEDGIAYVVEVIPNEAGWVHVLDVADPGDIRELAALQVGSLPWDILLYGDHLYVGENDGPLRILDVSDPAAPFQAGAFPATQVFAMRERDGVLFLTSGATVNGGFGILDLEDPLHPSLIGRYGDFGFSPFYLDVAGDFAYLGLLYDDLALFSIADLSDPVLLDEYRMSDSIFQILARDEHVFVTNGGAGLQVVENLLFAPSEAPSPAPGRHPLVRIHPNPFNARTAVRFELEEREPVSLQVFDLGGRLIRTILREVVMPGGSNEAAWDGRDESGRQAASGTYFFRLEAGGQVETKRAVLVK